MQKCYKCDLQFRDDNVRFCPYCGSPLAVDKEWQQAEKRKEEEARRKEEEKRNLQKKKEEWDLLCKPHLAKYEENMNGLKKFNFESYKYYNLVKSAQKLYSSGWDSYGRFTGVSSLEGLEKLKKANAECETILSLLNGNISGSNFSTAKSYLTKKYQELKDLIEELKFYNRNNIYPSILIDMFNAFRRGGKFKFNETMYSQTEDQFMIDAMKGLTQTDTMKKLEEVSYLSIPREERTKYNITTDYEYANKYHYDNVVMKYYRYKLYTKTTTSTTYFDFGYEGYDDKVSRLSSVSTNASDKLLSYLGDIISFIDLSKAHYDKLKDYNSTISLDEIKRNIEKPRFSSWERKVDNKVEDFKHTGYKYMQKVVSYGKKYNPW